MFSEFPYTNFHEINLDWIIKEFKRLENLGVLSVNGQTGEVILYQDARIQLPDVTEEQWNIYRGAAGLLSGIEFRPDGAYLISGTQRLKFLTRGDIPESAGVVSVNNKTGIVNLTGEDIPAAEEDPLTISDALDVVNDAIYDVGERVDNTQAGIAIVADGADHMSIGAGQYVYIKNHATLAEGMYISNEAIPANTAITAAMVTSDSNGGLNSLKENIVSLNNQIDTAYFTSYAIPANSSQNFTIPNNTRAVMFSAGLNANRNGIYSISAASGGNVSCYTLINAPNLTIAAAGTKTLKVTNTDPDGSIEVMFVDMINRKITVNS